jgi:hypothetical protein
MSTAGSAEVSKAKIYYIPFQIETYEAITPENIKEKASYSFEINDKNEIAELLHLTSSGDKKSSFTKKRVRLLMIIFDASERQIMVDAEGNVLEGGTQHALNTQDFEKLKTLLSELIKARGVPEK